MRSMREFFEKLPNIPTAPVLCPQCGDDMGWRPNITNQKYEPNDYCQRCHEKKEEASIEEQLNQIGVPKRYVSKTFTNIDPAHIGHRVLQVVYMHRDKSICLYGMPGSGKTHIAAALLRMRIENKEIDPARCIFAITPDLLANVRDGIKNSDMERRIERLARCQVLVLDDVGAERPTEFARETLYRIVNERYNHDRQTIVTSNMALHQGLEAHLGMRTVSRLSEMCEAIYTGDYDYRTHRRWSHGNKGGAA